MADSDDCVGAKDVVDNLGVRVAAIFVIFISSAIFTLMPIVAKRLPWLQLPQYMFDFARYFGSGVIIATGFVHLLYEASEALAHKCLIKSFRVFPMEYTFMFLAMLFTMVGEYFAYRIGADYVARKFRSGEQKVEDILRHHHHGVAPDEESLGIRGAEHDESKKNVAEDASGARPAAPAYSHAAENNVLLPAPAGELTVLEPESQHVLGNDELDDEENTQLQDTKEQEDPDKPISPGMSGAHAGSAEVLAVFILEFGILFHSVIIGLMLATTQYKRPPGTDEERGGAEFIVLFPAIVFHQLFEGMGLGVRLAFLPESLGTTIPVILAFAYALVTPVGMAVGLGVKNSYSVDTPKGYYVTGIIDALSAGILIYNGLVELIAHDFIFNERMQKASLNKVALNMFELWLGIAVMSLIGRWA